MDAPTTLPGSWDEAADIVVVGLGAAGFATSANVTIAEVTDGGGSEIAVTGSGNSINIRPASIHFCIHVCQLALHQLEGANGLTKLFSIMNIW